MEKLKLVTVLGTRPELIRLSEIIKLSDKLFNHILVHTGQNYDYELNGIFFKDLGLREPDYFLNVSGSNLGETIGNVISKSYDVFSIEKPSAILVLGDTNSVLCTIAAKRLKIPIFHMEAGNRCFDQNVPEEINRKISDHISDINLTYTENSRRYLLSEGFRKDHIFVTGSPLFEVLEKNKNAIMRSNILSELNLVKGNYIVVSLHREENLDIESNFIEMISCLNEVANYLKKVIIFSTHPRTKSKISKSQVVLHDLIKSFSPFGFFDYVQLQLNSFCVLSDSGTISEESAMLKFPAISIRTSTERPEAIDFGSILLGGLEKNNVLNAIRICIETFNSNSCMAPYEYNVKDVSTRVVRIIQSYTHVINRDIWRK
jgi:UDP-N-acetylglucosamine 2-epimerase